MRTQQNNITRYLNRFPRRFKDYKALSDFLVAMEDFITTVHHRLPQPESRLSHQCQRVAGECLLRLFEQAWKIHQDHAPRKTVKKASGKRQFSGASRKSGAISAGR